MYEEWTYFAVLKQLTFFIIVSILPRNLENSNLTRTDKVDTYQQSGFLTHSLVRYPPASTQPPTMEAKRGIRALDKQIYMSVLFKVFYFINPCIIS